jgi:hypothetical protein
MTLTRLLNEMDALVEGSDVEAWRRTFRATIGRLEAGEDVSDVARDIKSLFAGMGSISDLVIYRNGQVAAENDRFGRLRSLLYEQALKAIR